MSVPTSAVHAVRTVDDLEERLSRPSSELVHFFRALEGDLLILGVGGKMGPTLARLATRAVEASGKARRIIGVSSFSQEGLRERLMSFGCDTIQADLLAPGTLADLPDTPNVIYMVGRKFGSTGAEWNTWATNVLLAGMTAERFKDSRIVAFSSGNIYPFVPVGSGGATEDTPAGPVGEYAMSCLGRERMFDYWSHRAGTKVLHYRLNYAVECRYGVILDVAQKVWSQVPVDVSNGAMNVVWQGYANDVALRALALADSPPRILNVTGPETVSVRWLAHRLGALMGKEPMFEGVEGEQALLSNAAECHKLFGYPGVTLDEVVEIVAAWVMSGGATLNKPTHFETRDGKF